MLQPSRELPDVVAIEIKHQTLRAFRRLDISPVRERLHRLRHSADDQILAEQFHRHPMIALPHRLSLCKAPADQLHDGFGPKRPEELFEIHGEHLNLHLFARNDDVVDILPYRHQGTCFKVMEAPVLDQVLNRLARTWESLHLVKDDERLPPDQPDPCARLQQHEELVEIVKFLLEKLLDLRTCLREIYDEV